MTIQTSGYSGRRLVLIVDDQEINRELLGMILEDTYDLIFAENGQQALEIIRENKSMLSAILLDLMMPVMDGFETMENLRADEELRRIPVIVLTAEKSAELKSLQMGAVDFITKPFETHEVIQARVARIIELSEGRDLIQAAEREELTGLYTFIFFAEYAQQLVRYHPDWKMDALVLNIDRFHLLNDLHGRDYGDRVLRLLADEIQAFLEKTDGLACRADADLFYVYCRHQEDYEEILNAIQTGLSRQLGDVAHIRLRMGAYPSVDQKMEFELQMDRAKTACNMLRGNFAKAVMVYDDSLHEKELFNQSLVNGIQDAVDQKQFIVYFQPQYGIQADEPYLSSAEALVRWKHPEYGMVSPGTFIPLFESNGLISLVDNYVWREVAAQIRRWQEEFGITLPVSVNLSRIDLHDPALEEKLLGLLEENGLTPANLMLEVTESAYTDDADRMIAVVEHLRTLGFRIEMDDFGSGYSSLNMLSTMPIDVLKLDMKFIQNVQNEKDFRLIQLILDIADFLKVPVVAEGVENEEQCQMLKEAGCDLVQGYFFSKPVPPEEFARFFEDIRKE